MIINFEEFPDYRVRVDNFNHTLQKINIVPEVNEKTGKSNKNPGERWVEVGYYPNIGQACNGLIKDVMMDSDEEVSLQEFQQWYDSVVGRVDRVVVEE